MVRETGFTSFNDEGLLDFLNEVDIQGQKLHSMVIWHNGKKIHELSWSPYSPDRLHTLYSASKSFTSIAIGFAIEEGLVSEEDDVLSFFPDKLTNDPCENMRIMKVKHLLTMTTGFREDPHDFPVEGHMDWVENFLKAYVEEQPGSVFVYSTHATYMLSAIIQKVTGKKTSEYLDEKLFRKLHITDYWWEECPQGINTGGWGLMLSTLDLAKFGQFLLDKGSVNGEQLISRQWIEKATGCEVETRSSNPEATDNPEHLAGYGYQIWRSTVPGSYRVDGGFGQICLVLEEQNAVIAMTAGDNRSDLFGPVWRHLLPAFSNGTVINPDMVRSKLEQRKKQLTVYNPSGNLHNPKLERQYSGVEYVLSANQLGLQEIRFHFGLENTVRFGGTAGNYELELGYEDWIPGATPVRTEDTNTDISIIYEHVSAKGVWHQDCFEAIIVYNETPFFDRFKVYFMKEALAIDFKRSIWHKGENLDGLILGVQKKLLHEKDLPFVESEESRA